VKSQASTVLWAKVLLNLSMLQVHDLQYAFCSQYCTWTRSHRGRHYDCASYTVFTRC